jgi:hypothetical protein
MFNPKGSSASYAITAWVAFSLGLAGCASDSSESRNPLNPLQSSEGITLEEFVGILDSGPTRLEVELLNGHLVAGEIEAERAEGLFDEEAIESRVTDLLVVGDQGTLLLELAGLRIGFTPETRFELEDSDAVLTFNDFIARVEQALGLGLRPDLEVERFPPAAPQAPDDPTFIAREIKIDFEGKADEPQIEIIVDADNLELNPAPPPDAWIRVLGLRIEIRATEGITELEGQD